MTQVLRMKVIALRVTQECTALTKDKKNPLCFVRKGGTVREGRGQLNQMRLVLLMVLIVTVLM